MSGSDSNQTAVSSSGLPAESQPALPQSKLSRRGTILIGFLLFIFVAGAFAPSLRNGFISYDDRIYITENPHVLHGLSWDDVRWAFTTSEAGNWHPLTWVSHMADWQIFGTRPWGHHLTSVLLHSINAVLLFLFLFQATGARWRSASVALLFGLHPLGVESVCWAAERKNVLSTTFWLLTLMAYVSYTRRLGKPKDRPLLWYALSLAFFILGLLSKAMLVTLPCVLLLLDFWPLERISIFQSEAQGSETENTPRKARIILNLLLEKIPFFAITILFSVLTFLIQRGGRAVVTMESLSLFARIENGLVSYSRYLGKLIWPANLAVIYPHPGFWPWTTVLLAGLVLMVMSAVVFARRRRQPWMLIGWLWYLGTLVPVIGLVQVGVQSMADRYAYVPMIGIFMLVIWSLGDLLMRWRLGYMAVLGVSAAAILCFVDTQKQIGYWKNSETLFKHTLAITTNNKLAHYCLGSAFDKEGRLEEAVQEYREALKIWPGYSDARNNLGVVLAQQGKFEAAAFEFRAAVADNPAYAEAYCNLGYALYQQGQFNEAAAALGQALKLRPDYAEAHNTLGITLDAQGNPTGAVAEFREALAFNPNHIEAHFNLGFALHRLGKLDEAIAEYQRAQELDPGYAEAHGNLGVALKARGRTDEAITQFQEALRLRPNSSEIHYNLGNLLMEKGRLDDAIAEYREALRLKPDSAETHNNLGMALRKKGLVEEANAEFQKALEARGGSNQPAHR